MNELISVDAPWVHRIDDSQASAELVPALAKADFSVALNGARMRTREKLFAEYARAFGFPAYFGGNWHAFDECIQDLSWISARSFLTVVINATEVLEDEGSGQEDFVTTVGNAGKYWSQTFGLGYERGHGEIPFNTILVS